MNPRLLAGALKASALLRATYGSETGVALVAQHGQVIATKDGALLLRAAGVADPVEEAGFRIVSEACLRVGDVAGDGTSTTGILLGEVLREAQKDLYARDGLLVLEGLRQDLRECRAYLETQRQVANPETLREVVFRASHEDELLTNILLKAVMAVGDTGAISVLNGLGSSVTLELQDGYLLEGVRTSESADRWLKCPYVALTNRTLTTVADVQELLEAAPGGPRELLLIAPGVWGDALKTLRMNEREIPWAWVQAPHSGPRQADYLRDLGALTGAVPYMEGVEIQFGDLEEAWIEGGRVVLSPLADRAEEIDRYCEALLRVEQSFEHDQDLGEQRAAALRGGLALIRVGGLTTAERTDRKSRLEDAHRAAQMSLEGGLVRGGALQEGAGRGILGAALKRVPLGRPDVLVPLRGVVAMLEVVEGTVATVLRSTHVLYRVPRDEKAALPLGDRH